jgi:hypothetical protein
MVQIRVITPSLSVRFPILVAKGLWKILQTMRNKTLVEDRIDGSSNFSSWKSRLQITLEEDNLLSVIQKDLPETTIDEEKEESKEDDVKERKIIIYSERDCPTRKKERQLSSIVDVDSEPHQRDEDIKVEAFLFISTLLGTVPTDNDIWLIDNGALRHMTGYRYHMTDLVEKETSLHVVLGYNARYNVKWVGTYTFQLDSDIPLQLSEVLYVPGMKRNLVFVSALEDKGYKVTFSEGKFLAWHKNSHMDYARVIGVRENNLYRLIV